MGATSVRSKREQEQGKPGHSDYNPSVFLSLMTSPVKRYNSRTLG